MVPILFPVPRSWPWGRGPYSKLFTLGLPWVSPGRTWVGPEGKAPAVRFRDILPSPGGKEMSSADFALWARVVGGTWGSTVVQAQQVTTSET